MGVTCGLSFQKDSDLEPNVEWMHRQQDKVRNLVNARSGGTQVPKTHLGLHGYKCCTTSWLSVSACAPALGVDLCSSDIRNLPFDLAQPSDSGSRVIASFVDVVHTFWLSLPS